MWELDCEESWAPKNGCFWTMVLGKTLESPLDCKEIQPVHSEGDQSWVFFGRNDAKAETLVFWLPHVKQVDSLGKTLMLGGIGGRRGKGWQRMRWLDGITDSMDESEWTPGVGDGRGGLACCDSWGCKESETTERLNWTEEANLEQAESEFFLWHTVCGPGKRTSVLSLMKMEIWDPSCFPIVDFNKVGHCKGSLNLRKHLLIKTELKLVHSCFLSS